MKRTFSLLSSAVLSALLPSAASAGLVALPLAHNGDDVTLAVEAGAAWLAGEARQHVFAEGEGERLSRTDRNLENVFLIGGAGSIRTQSISVNAGIWGGRSPNGSCAVKRHVWVQDDTSVQQDAGAAGGTGDTGTDATLDEALVFDLNVSWDLIDARSGWRLYPFAGIRTDRFEWEDRVLGAPLEVEGKNEEKDESGDEGEGEDKEEKGKEKKEDASPAEPVIWNAAYRQKYLQPYAGLGVSCMVGRHLSLSAYARFSPGYEGEERENRFSRRNTISTSDKVKRKFCDNMAYGAGFRAEWAFTGNLALFLGIDWTHYDMGKTGITTVTSTRRNKTVKRKGEDEEPETSGGIDLEYLAGSLGLVWRF